MESAVPEYRASDWLSDDVSHKPGLRTSLFTAVFKQNKDFCYKLETQLTKDVLYCTLLYYTLRGIDVVTTTICCTNQI
jgi:hypothetical protein